MKDGDNKSLSADKTGIKVIAFITVITVFILLCSLFFYYIDVKNHVPGEMTANLILFLSVAGAIAVYTVYWESKKDDGSQSEAFLKKAARRAKVGSAAIDIIKWGLFAAIVYIFLFSDPMTV